jgi:hypothetical protein
MKARILATLRNLLLIWGVVSLAATIGLGAFVVFQFGPGNREQVDTASTHDVRFVLNWCRLGEERIEKVIHSYVSPRSFTGDYLDAYAIKISRLEVSELAATTSETSGRWYRGDQLPPVVNDAIEFFGAWLGSDEIRWFPKEAELRSKNVYVYPWAIYTHEVRPTAVELIFVRPSDNMVFYFGSKT